MKLIPVYWYLDELKNLLVSIADPFRLSRKFACDFCWPILTVLKTCLWLLLTHFDGLENLLVTIADPFWRAQKFAFDYCHPQCICFLTWKCRKKMKHAVENFVEEKQKWKKDLKPKIWKFPEFITKNDCYQSSVKIFQVEFSISTCQELPPILL